MQMLVDKEKLRIVQQKAFYCAEFEVPEHTVRKAAAVQSAAEEIETLLRLVQNGTVPDEFMTGTLEAIVGTLESKFSTAARVRRRNKENSE